MRARSTPARCRSRSTTAICGRAMCWWGRAVMPSSTGKTSGSRTPSSAHFNSWPARTSTADSPTRRPRTPPSARRIWRVGAAGPRCRACGRLSTWRTTSPPSPSPRATAATRPRWSRPIPGCARWRPSASGASSHVAALPDEPEAHLRAHARAVGELDDLDRHRFQPAGILERTAVDGVEADVLAHRDHRLLRGFVVASDEERNLLSLHRARRHRSCKRRVEGLDHLRLGRLLLQLLGAAGGEPDSKLHLLVERVRRIHEDLAVGRRAQLAQRIVDCTERYCQDDDLRAESRLTQLRGFLAHGGGLVAHARQTLLQGGADVPITRDGNSWLHGALRSAAVRRIAGHHRPGAQHCTPALPGTCGAAPGSSGR